MSTAEPVPGATPASPARVSLSKNPNNIDVLSKLTKLGALRQAWKLTPEEFEAKKAELRARLW